MPKLSEAQEQVLRTMLDFGCGVGTYEGVQLNSRARAWFVGEAARHPTRRFVSISTVRALVRRELIVETDGPWPPTRHHFITTPKGRELAKELQHAEAE